MGRANPGAMVARRGHPGPGPQGVRVGGKWEGKLPLGKDEAIKGH